MRRFITSCRGTQLRLEISGYQSRSRIECEIGPGPLEKHSKPIPKAHQKNDVHKQPDEPGRKAAQVDKIQIRDCFVPSNRSHASLVPIAESPRFAVLDHSQNISGGVTALLHCD